MERKLIGSACSDSNQGHADIDSKARLGKQWTAEALLLMLLLRTGLLLFGIEVGKTQRDTRMVAVDQRAD